MITNLLVLLLVVGASSTTYPLVCRRDPEEDKLQHLTLSSETYPVKPLFAIFTLAMAIEGIPYELAVDTGSADLFVKGENMTGNPVKKLSCSTCLQNNRKASILYLDGEVQTYLYLANVGIGNHSFPQFILVAYQANTSNFDSMGGILGLSFPKLAVNENPGFMSTLINNKIIKRKMFGIKLSFKKPNTSFITFGGFDKSLLAPNAQILYYPILTNEAQYILAVDGMLIGEYALSVFSTLLDTGNTCISVPNIFTEEVLDSFNKGKNYCQFNPQVGNTKFKLLVCLVTDFDLLPTFRIRIGGDQYQLPPEYYLDSCFKRANNAYACRALVEVVQDSDFLYLGAVFFQRYYAVFDIEQRRIGLARNDDITTIADVLA